MKNSALRLAGRGLLRVWPAGRRQGLPPISTGTWPAAWAGMFAGMLDGGGLLMPAPPMAAGTRPAAWPGRLAGMLSGGGLVTALDIPVEPFMPEPPIPVGT